VGVPAGETRTGAAKDATCRQHDGLNIWTYRPVHQWTLARGTVVFGPTGTSCGSRMRREACSLIDQLLRIGRLAAQAGVSPRTIDYYTGLGLLEPAARTEGNFRLYSPDAIDRIAMIRSLEEHGLSLDEIAAALSAPAVDLRGVLERLDQSLTALRSVVDAVAPDVQQVFTAIAARAHGLLLTALELAPALQPPPS
jgi:MerR family copper efflux transcriptional regulator